MIVVTGAAGNVGRELVAQLVAAGQPVRAIVRRSAASQSLPPEAETVVADLNRPDSLSDHERHAGASYRLSGPEALTPADRARILGQVLERNLHFVGLTNEEARAEMTASMPGPYVDAFFSFFAAGTVDETTVQPTVQQLLGRPPGSFAQWAENHAHLFAS